MILYILINYFDFNNEYLFYFIFYVFITFKKFKLKSLIIAISIFTGLNIIYL